MTWLQLVNMKLKARQAKGEHPSIKDVAAEAKKDWALIKAGKHPQYVQGKAVITRKKKSAKTEKSGSTRKLKQQGGTHTRKMVDVAKLEGKLCKKCMTTVKRYSRTMHGGTGTGLPEPASADDFAAKPSTISNSTGTINPTIKGGLFQAQCGGKGKGKKKKSKKGGCGCGTVMGGGEEEEEKEEAAAASPTESEVQKEKTETKEEEEEKEDEDEEEEKHEEKEKEEETTASTPTPTPTPAPAATAAQEQDTSDEEDD